jgi:hypothetical protein
MNFSYNALYLTSSEYATDQSAGISEQQISYESNDFNAIPLIEYKPVMKYKVPDYVAWIQCKLK